MEAHTESAGKLQDKQHPLADGLPLPHGASVKNLTSHFANLGPHPSPAQGNVRTVGTSEKEAGHSEIAQAPAEHAAPVATAAAVTEKEPPYTDTQAKIVTEIITTEKSYCKQLTSLCDQLTKAIEDLEKGSMTASKQETINKLKEMRGNYQVLLNLSNAFQQELGVENMDPASVKDGKLPDLPNMEKVAKAFTKFAPEFKRYSNLAINYESYNTFLFDEKSKTAGMKNKSLDALRNTPSPTGLALSALLITGIQRLPRYVMLAEQLVKKTSADHPQYGSMKTALGEVQKTAKYVNEQSHIKENMDKQTKFDLALQKFPSEESIKVMKENYAGFPHTPELKEAGEKCKPGERQLEQFTNLGAELAKIDPYSEKGNKFATGLLLSLNITPDETEGINKSIEALKFSKDGEARKTASNLEALSNALKRLSFDKAYANPTSRSNYPAMKENYLAIQHPSNKWNEKVFNDLTGIVELYNMQRSDKTTDWKTLVQVGIAFEKAKLEESDENIDKFITGFCLSINKDEIRAIANEIKSLTSKHNLSDSDKFKLEQLTNLAKTIMDARGASSETASILKGAFI